jgi:nitrogen fixation protein NifU and related proteins
MDLYQEQLMDHYRYPRNYGTLENPDMVTQTFNPSCGDQVAYQAHIKNNTIVALKFQGKGCVISQAAASLLSESCINKELEYIESLTKDTMITLIGISLGPTRLRCALLALEALHQGIAQYAR